MTDGTTAIAIYYNGNNWGFGQVVGVPPPPATGPAFHSAFWRNDP